MPFFKNTFSKLDQDTAFNKVDNESMFDARNLEPTSNDPSKSGALNSVKGNVETSWTTISGLSVIGSKKYRNKMLLMCCTDDTATPTHSLGYLVSADLGKSGILNFHDFTFLYSGYLNFSKQNPIEDIVIFYENVNIIKAYWTDNYNDFRYCNLADPLLSSWTPDDFNIVQKMDLSTPIMQGIISGSIPVGMVQYAYRLYKLHGPVSNFSPCSPLYPLSTSPLSLGDTIKFKGSDNVDSQGNPLSSGKGIQLKIENVDTDYDRIEVVAIHYATLNGVPTINIVSINSISSTIYVIDEGLYNNGSYTLAEFTLINNPFKCKSLTTKNNILFALNIQQEEFDFDFDSRAYRWDRNVYTHPTSFTKKLCKLYEIDGSYWLNDRDNPERWDHYSATNIWISTVSGMINLPSDIDAICRNNIEYDKIGSTFIYQKDGTTIGGEGPNIKYTFSLNTAINIDEIATTPTSFKTSNNLKPNYYKGMESPVHNQQSRTWQRDEIYRMMMIGFDDKGRHSPAKWIGDIRMPTTYHLNTSGTTTQMFPLKIDFTFYNLPSEVKYVQIVYVKRTDADKTIVCQGTIGFFYKSGGIYYNHLVRPPSKNIGSYTGLPNFNKTHIGIFSPEISFYKNFNQSSDDYIEIIGECIGQYTSAYSTHKLWEIEKYHTFTRKTANNNNWTKVNSARIQNTTTSPDLIAKDESFEDLSFRPVVAHDDNNIQKIGNLGTCLLVKLSGNGLDTTGLTGSKFMIVNYRRNLWGSQYGGQSYEDRTRNECIPASDIALVSAGSATISAIYGDTYIAYADHLTSYYNDFYAHESTNTMTYASVELFPIETSVNLPYRLDDCWSKISENIPAAYWIREKGNNSFTIQLDSSSDPIDYNEGWSDLYLENTVYKRIADARKYYPAPLDYDPQSNNDTLVMASSMKEGQEEIDPWTQWANNETINLDKSYGPGNKLVSWRNNLLFLQEDAVGTLSVLDRSTVSDVQGKDTTLGTGAILARYDILATNMGLSTRFSLTESQNGVYFYDNKRKRLHRFLNSIEDLATIRGMNSYLNAITNFIDNPISANYNSGKGFLMTYNPSKNQIWFTVKSGLDSGITLVFNEVKDSFSHTIDTRVVHYMVFDNLLYSCHDNRLYKENVGYPGYFFGYYYDSYVSLIMCPVPNMVHTLTNLEVTSEVYTSAGVSVHTRSIDKFQIVNDYQNTGLITLTSANRRRLLRTWRINVGRNIGDTARLRDTYHKIILKFTNDVNHHSIVLHDLISLYMVPAESIANKMTQK